MDMNSNMVPVLDQGYVRLIDHMGSDLSTVNAARASYAKEVSEMSQADARLISFLMREGHFSTLRHAFVTFEVKAPLMIARQWWKYVVGSAHTDPMTGWNESCLPGDQMLMTTEGQMPVEVYYEMFTSHPITCPELFYFDGTEGLVSQKAKNVWIPAAKADLYTIITEDGHTITATANHRFPVEGIGDLELLMIDVGDALYVDDGGEAVTSRVIDVFKVDRHETVYDIEMDGQPYFIANGIQTHNSRRYITSDEEFYHIKSNEWRSKPENSKQGSGDLIDPFTGAFFSEAFNEWAENGNRIYKSALDAGICPEQARVFLPAYSLYVTWRWSCSLQGLIHFLHQRLADDAQVEIQKYALAVHRLSQPLYPVTFASAELS